MTRGPLSVARFFNAPKVYRVGVFGGKSSGKTSLLAALGMTGRPAHPLRYTATRRAHLPGGPTPAGDPDAWAPADLRRDPTRAFVRANRWIDRAEADLRAGRQPQGNDETIPPLLLVYEFTDPDHGSLTVEVVEFAGELLRPNNSAADNRAVLGAFLRAVDGLLVLAAAPTRVGEAIDPPADLELLLQAMHGWADGRRAGTRVAVPVGLILGMWDRRGNPDAAADRREAEVAELFAASPAHQRAWDVVSAVSARARRFAASAYGRHAADPGSDGRPRPHADRPAAFPLPAFGLEDPFVWACRESDAVAREALADAPPPNPRRFWAVGASLRARAAAWDVAARTPAGEAAHRDAAALARRAGRVAAVQLAACAAAALAVAVGVGLGVEGTIDARHRQNTLVTLDDPASSDAEVDRACAWLDGYAGSGWYRHRVSKVWFSADDAAERRAGVAATREARAWAEADGATDPGVQLPLLRRYREKYPAGPNADAADRKVREIERAAEAARKRATRQAAVADLRTRFDAARPGQDERKLLALQGEFARLPAPEDGVESDEDVRTRAALGDEIRTALVSLSNAAAREKKTKEWAQKKNGIEAALNRLELTRAATDLRACAVLEADVPDVRAYREGFGARAVGAAEREAGKAVASRTWDAVAGKLEAALGDTDVTAVTDEKARTRLADVVKTLKAAKDKALYDDFRGVQTRANADRYLQQVPQGIMRPTVDAFVAWDNGRAAPQKLALEVEVAWGNWADDVDTDVLVWVKDPVTGDFWKKRIERRLRSKKGGTSETLRTDEFLCPPTATLQVWVEVERAPGTYLINDRLKAERKAEADAGLTPEGRPPGATLDLEKVTGSDRGVKVKLRVTGVPARPPVGEWKE